MKHGTTVIIRVGLRPSISADEPAMAPPNKAPTGVIAYGNNKCMDSMQSLTP